MSKVKTHPNGTASMPIIQAGSEPATTPLDLSGVRVSPRRFRVTVRDAGTGEILHVDILNLSSAAARATFARAIADRSAVSRDFVAAELLTLAGKIQEQEADAPATAGVEAGPNYLAIDAPDDADRHGLYSVSGSGKRRLTNFVAIIDEDVNVVDELADSRRFVGHTALEGRRGEFALTAEEFASNDKLKAALFRAAGPRAMILCPRIEELRTAISAGSAPARRTVTTTHGWVERDGGWVYLTTNGHVDADGFHQAKADHPILVDLGGDEVAGQLRLRRLDSEALARGRAHLAEDFLRLHDRRVMFPLLGAVALAALMPFAGATQRFALWIRGLTGAGKSFAAKLALNFFGDFDPAPGAGRFANWTWTPNRLEKCGYFHRGVLFLVDDFKPELAGAAGAVRVVQGYADGHGRGRLQADTRTATVWPIRGLLVATGEDVIQHHASALARLIVVDAPNAPKDLERGARCLEHRALYRGVMADFLAHLIRKGRLEGFAGTVEMYSGFFYKGIAGRQNDARIAGNFGMLAAALGEMALYLDQACPSLIHDVNEFIGEDLVAMRDAMLGHAEGQQTSEIFLGELRGLIGTKAARITGWSDASSNDPRKLIGRLFEAAGCLALSLEGAMAEVQQSLRAQGRPPLAASHAALLDQLCRDGLLLEDDLQAMTPDHEGAKTFRRRLVAGGGQVRVVLFPRSVLVTADDQEGLEA